MVELLPGLLAGGAPPGGIVELLPGLPPGSIVELGDTLPESSSVGAVVSDFLSVHPDITTIDISSKPITKKTYFFHYITSRVIEI